MQENIGKTRIELFDIAKAIAIIMVVYGHCSHSHHFVYLIHVLVFFVISGYFFKDKYVETTKNFFNFVRKKFFHLLLPYFTINGVFVCMHNLLLQMEIYKLSTDTISYASFIVPYYNTLYDYIISMFTHIEPLVQPIWFLLVLFNVSFIFGCISFCTSKIKNNSELVRIIIILLFLLLGYVLYLRHINVFYIGTTFSAITAYYVGYLLSKYTKIYDITFWVFILSFLILILINMELSQVISLAKNSYHNPGLLILLSIVGFIFIIFIAKLIENIKFLSNLFCYIGQNTMIILIFHFSAFKVVNAIKFLIGVIPLNQIYQRYIGEDCFSIIVNLCCGVAIPILINVLYQKLRGKLNA